LLSFVRAHPCAQAITQCRLGANEVFERAKCIEPSLADLAMDATDYKAAIAKAKDTAEKVALARKLATARFASGVVPELDDCFAALELR
jgi:hypothetical protein